MEQRHITLDEIYNILLELMSKMKKIDQYIEDLEFARRTEEALAEIEVGKGKTYSLEEFQKRLNNG